MHYKSLILLSSEIEIPHYPRVSGLSNSVVITIFVHAPAVESETLNESYFM